MKIIMNDNWLGKLLDHPTNICVFGWGILWRLVCAVAATTFLIGYVWLWSRAFHDGFIMGIPMAFLAWFIMTLIAGAALCGSAEYWYDSAYVKRFRASVAAMCPTIEWNKE
jgi:hypothetical protein